MDEKIRNAVYQAYTGESKASLRLKVFAEKAENEGYPQLAKLFRVISFSEELHGKRALRLLKEIKSTEENLAESFESETRVAGVAYDEFIKYAEAAGDKAASLYFSQSRDVEEIHAKLYKEAMDHVLEERQTTYYVCDICGYVSDGVLPEECPVCAAKKDRFVTFE
ncbi:MAG: Rubrerythrin-2 [Deltaproteobacteria bacterium ADurb.BinA179]|nr:rubrerythrin family protein [Deltaproteobacteria bacterium]MDI9541990.1 rubrerythrin family protein [Pseudomonadota bacterium]OPZ29333.1 MAG: Rubrerythrin-2 [Deltaproteobacteria bacterium ADurb.BinA179]HRR22495.1 rubrerythrin family protein [Desulfomonilia bacterium]HNR50729.1 rubrerythrin family protein [Deltaproteobacteria bacterium]